MTMLPRNDFDRARKNDWLGPLKSRQISWILSISMWTVDTVRAYNIILSCNAEIIICVNNSSAAVPVNSVQHFHNNNLVP